PRGGGGGPPDRDGAEADASCPVAPAPPPGRAGAAARPGARAGPRAPPARARSVPGTRFDEPGRSRAMCRGLRRRGRMGDTIDWMLTLTGQLEDWILGVADAWWDHLLVYLFAALDGFFPSVPSESTIVTRPYLWATPRDATVLTL